MSLKLFLLILILIPLVILVLIFKSGLNRNSPTSSSLLDSQPTTHLPAEERATSRERIVREAGEWQAEAGNSQPAPAVTVSVNFLPPQSDSQTLAFEVSLNTHSVNLDDIDFQKSVILEASGRKFSPLEAKTEGAGLPAEASAKAGHHRSAEVKFNRLSPPFKIIFSETPQTARQEFEFDELN